MESRERIEDAAAAFIARRGTIEWTHADEAELGAWVAASVSHRAAYYRLNAAWHEAGRLQALRAGNYTSPFEEARRGATGDPGEPSVRALQTVPLASSGEPRVSGRVRYALAASVMLAIATGMTWYLWPAGPSYRTEVGGLAAVPLADGSKITLNTDSEIRVAVNETERRVNLERGEAYFEVARDPTRPFIVQAGDKRVIAVGTAFSVRRQENGSDDVIVVVTEGKVRLETEMRRATPSANLSAGDRRERTRAAGSEVGGEVILAAGTIARAKDDALLVEEDRASEIERTLTWRNGQLTFRDTPLADAVAEFNRYNTRKIVIDHPSVAALQVGGIFRATNVDPFVRLLQEAFPIEITETDGKIVLTAR